MPSESPASVLFRDDGTAIDTSADGRVAVEVSDGNTDQMLGLILLELKKLNGMMAYIVEDEWDED